MANGFMGRAVELAVENARAGRGGPFGAVVVRDGEIVAEGTNLVTSTNDPTAHGEVVAIREACRRLGTFDLTGCEIYASCEPCPMCLAAIYWARLERVYYGAGRLDAARFGFDDERIYEEIGRAAPQRSIPMEGLMRDEALEAFRVWESLPDKTEY